MDEPRPIRYQVAPRVLFQGVHGEMVLLDLASERYFGLNEVGARIWTLLQEGMSTVAIVDTLEREFEAPRERLEQDLQGLLAQLLDAGLVVAIP